MCRSTSIMGDIVNISSIVQSCNPLELPSLPFEGRTKTFPLISGIYFVYKGLELVYIGQSFNIRERFNSFHTVTSHYVTRREKDLKLCWLEMLPDRTILNKAEWSFIVKYYPSLNNTTPGQKRLTEAWRKKLQKSALLP